MKKFAYILTLCAACMIGCGETNSDSDYTSVDETPMSDGSHGGHSHAHEEGPHGGKILELADDHSYHGEVCLDEGGKTLTFYVLGGDLKTPVPADDFEFEVDKEDGSEVELEATAKPLEGEADGKSSVYSIDVSSLGEVDLDHMHAHVHVTVDGKEMEGALAHDHDHGDHDHGDHEHGDHDHGDHDHGEKHEHGDKDEHHADDHDKEDGHDHDDDDHKKEDEKGDS